MPPAWPPATYNLLAMVYQKILCACSHVSGNSFRHFSRLTLTHRWGTREALLRGCRRFLDAHAAACSEPHIPLRGFNHSGKALPDDFGNLAPKQCHVIRNGEVYVGKARAYIVFYSCSTSIWVQSHGLHFFCNPAIVSGMRIAPLTGSGVALPRDAPGRRGRLGSGSPTSKRPVRLQKLHLLQRAGQVGGGYTEVVSLCAASGSS